MTSKIEMLSWRRREIAQLLLWSGLEDELRMSKTMLCKFISRMKSLGRLQSLHEVLRETSPAKSEFESSQAAFDGERQSGYLLTEKGRLRADVAASEWKTTRQRMLKYRDGQSKRQKIPPNGAIRR
jgi:hypothetical protein